jgi:hypothetical protein
LKLTGNLQKVSGKRLTRRDVVTSNFTNCHKASIVGDRLCGASSLCFGLNAIDPTEAAHHIDVASGTKGQCHIPLEHSVVKPKLAVQKLHRGATAITLLTRKPILEEFPNYLKNFALAHSNFFLLLSGNSLKSRMNSHL